MQIFDPWEKILHNSAFRTPHSEFLFIYDKQNEVRGAYALLTFVHFVITS